MHISVVETLDGKIVTDTDEHISEREYDVRIGFVYPIGFGNISIRSDGTPILSVSYSTQLLGKYNVPDATLSGKFVDAGVEYHLKEGDVIISRGLTFDERKLSVYTYTITSV